MFNRMENLKMEMRQYDIHTDLALETRERFAGDGGEIEGVALKETYIEHAQLKITCVDILNEQGASVMGREIGTYITLEADFRDHEADCRDILAEQIRLLLPQSAKKIFIVGLGNKEMTADSIGPIAVSHLWITGHLMEEGVKVSAIVPGVMAQTGMETAQIIEGIVKEYKPDVVIVVDALAARNCARLGTTIQLTDTGINPGSGVGNHRKGINEKTLGIPVIAIGVPTVVGAATIACDTLDSLVAFLDKWEEMRSVSDTLRQMREEEKYKFMKEVLEPQIKSLYVTPKDIDERVVHLGGFIADGINEAVYGYLS